jgi:hypothetical protein
MTWGQYYNWAPRDLIKSNEMNHNFGLLFTQISSFKDSGITGTGDLSFSAGGTNKDINITPSGTGSVKIHGNTINEGQVVYQVKDLGNRADGNLTINWNEGQMQYVKVGTGKSCGTIVLSNLIEGGSYTLVVELDANANASPCSFQGGDYTFKTPSPNAYTAAGYTNIFSFLVIKGKVYITNAGPF